MTSHVEMVFWDVQHGHSTYIKTPNNKHIVIDLGIGDYSGGKAEFSPLRHLRYVYNIQKLDYVIITHPHLDHIDDILNFDLLNPIALLIPKHLSNSEIMEGVRDRDKAKFEKYCEINERYKGSLDGTENDPSIPENFGGIQITSFQPGKSNKSNFNNHSIVTVIEYQGIKVVIPGDNEENSLSELMERPDFRHAIMDSYILLAPHHGRVNGYHSEFVKLVNPRLTIVSDGRFCDTSANQRYSQMSRGWLVHKEGSLPSNRKCLTTNSDGEIFVKFGYDFTSTEEDKRFLQVSIK